MNRIERFAVDRQSVIGEHDVSQRDAHVVVVIAAGASGDAQREWQRIRGVPFDLRDRRTETGGRTSWRRRRRR